MSGTRYLALAVVLRALRDMQNHGAKITTAPTAKEHLDAIVWLGSSRAAVWFEAAEIDQLNVLREQKNMAVILIAHSAPARRVDPETEGAMQMAPKLQKYANEYLCESMDCIFYAKHDEVLKTIAQGFSNTVKKPKELSRRSF